MTRFITSSAIFFVLLFCHTNLQSQTFYLKGTNGNFYSEHIDVDKLSDSQVTIKLHYTPSEECACEETELITIKKDVAGQFRCHFHDSKENLIIVNIENSKVSYIEVINPDDSMCCEVASGKYYIKK